MLCDVESADNQGLTFGLLSRATSDPAPAIRHRHDVGGRNAQHLECVMRLVFGKGYEVVAPLLRLRDEPWHPHGSVERLLDPIHEAGQTGFLAAHLRKPAQ
jgi:hypothetical protein